jgi:adenosylhomocysteine nucleosidase
VLAIILSLFVTVGQTGVIGIMSAMEIELEYIGSDMLVESVDTIGASVYKLGQLEGIPCVMVHGGVGKVGAAHAAQILIIHYGVDAVIFTGVAGGIDPDLGIGDIVISDDVVHHDFGQILPERFVPFDTIGYPADSILVGLAQQASANVVLETIPEAIRGEEAMPRVTLGRVATGDQFISSEAKRLWIEQTFHADCVEMEGAAVAQICTLHKVPFVIIRSLSDLANEDAEVDFQSFVIYAAKNSSMLVKEMLRLLGDQ